LLQALEPRQRDGNGDVPAELGLQRPRRQHTRSPRRRPRFAGAAAHRRQAVQVHE
jgi:hypothetical protein